MSIRSKADKVGDVVRTIPLTEDQYLRFRRVCGFNETMMEFVSQLLERATEQQMLREESLWAELRTLAAIDPATELPELNWIQRAIVVRKRSDNE